MTNGIEKGVIIKKKNCLAYSFLIVNDISFYKIFLLLPLLYFTLVLSAIFLAYILLTKNFFHQKYFLFVFWVSLFLFLLIVFLPFHVDDVFLAPESVDN